MLHSNKTLTPVNVEDPAYGASFTVPPMATYYLTKYQVGLDFNGYLVYDKWHPDGYIVGTYTKSCGGTAVSPSDVHIELTE